MALTFDESTLKARRAQGARKSLQEKKAASVNDYKRSLRCRLCRESEPACLDLHHLDPSTKDMTVSEALRAYSIERVWKEIEKCVVLCSNCHRKFHAGIMELPDY